MRLPVIFFVICGILSFPPCYSHSNLRGSAWSDCITKRAPQPSVAYLGESGDSDTIESKKGFFSDLDVRLGFGFGTNIMGFKIERDLTVDNALYAEMEAFVPGVQLSFVTDIRISKHVNLRFLPGLSFGFREIAFYEGDPRHIAEREGANSIPAVSPAFLEFPLLVKYKILDNNKANPYLLGGVNFRYDMAAKKAFDGESNTYIRLNQADFYFELGFGLETYPKYFKFAPEIKVAMGLNNMHSKETRDPYPEFSNSISKLSSFIVMLNLFFE